METCLNRMKILWKKQELRLDSVIAFAPNGQRVCSNIVLASATDMQHAQKWTHMSPAGKTTVAERQDCTGMGTFPQGMWINHDQWD